MPPSRFGFFRRSARRLPPYKSKEREKNERSDQGAKYSTDQVRSSKADDAEEHAAKKGSDHPHHQIANPSKTTALGQDTAEPSGDEADDEGCDELRKGNHSGPDARPYLAGSADWVRNVMRPSISMRRFRSNSSSCSTVLS
jgi:hypothetical protein